MAQGGRRHPDDITEKEHVDYIQHLATTDGLLQSPIDLDISAMHFMQLSDLCWYNYDQIGSKMKITNTGHTVILSGKWSGKRPYLNHGPLLGSYVFSQLHFHWGESDKAGSEHTVRGRSYPMEMHVVHFKSIYLTQEVALKQPDGLVIIAYFFEIQKENNPDLKNVIDSLQCITQPQTSVRVKPMPLMNITKPFERDYFLYWGSVLTTSCSHMILWAVCREPVGISSAQVSQFRNLIDENNEPLVRNYRDIQPLEDRSVFHISPERSTSRTILPIPTRIMPIIPRTNYSPDAPQSSTHSEPTSKEKPETQKKSPGSAPRRVQAMESNYSRYIKLKSKSSPSLTSANEEYINVSHKARMLERSILESTDTLNSKKYSSKLMEEPHMITTLKQCE